MAKVAFILLCHKDPDSVIKQAEMLTAVGDYVSIHFDARAKADAYDQLRGALDGNPNVVFADKRIKCGWGEWSLVKASLIATEAAFQAFDDATHFYLLSGDCAAIKSAKYVHDFLDRNDQDFIESFDFFETDWIKTGMKKERLIYRHFFNERTRRGLFYTSFNLQRRLGLARAIPKDIQVHIGSQWWCLRRHTFALVLEFIRSRPDVVRFFRTTWIPDETFFQTLVNHLVPEAEIRTRSLTFLMFTDYGMPVTFYNDHYSLLLGQDFLFARKISPGAHDLKQRLRALYNNDDAEFRISNEGWNLFRFLTSRGRNGRRFATRFWEAKSKIGRQRELMIVVCKKWHVAKRLVQRISQETGFPAVEYLFNEENTPLPDLGGIQKTVAKRDRHRRALVRMLFDYYQTDRMIMCLDPASFDLIQDFCSDRSVTKLLEVKCAFSDDYLIGHARRVGLASEHTSAESLGRLLPAIHGDMDFESDQIAEADFDNHVIIDEAFPIEENAELLAEFLDEPVDLARDIMQTEYLFKD